MTLVDLLKEMGVNYVSHGDSTKVTHGWVGLPCPFCHHVSQDGDENLLGINVRTGFITCWYCGPKRSGETLAALTDKPIGECLKLLGETDKVYASEDRVRGTLKLPEPRGNLLPAHRNYLKSRHLDPDEIVRVWGVEATSIGSRVPWSLVIPIADERGITVSWMTRRISDRDPARRYMAAPPEEESVPAKTVLYGEHLTRHAVIVVEGPVDAWAVGPGAVATLGVNISKAQIARIARFPLRVVVMDSEPAAQARGNAVCRALTPLDGTTVRVELERGTDAASCLASHSGRREISELRKRFLN